MEDGQVADEAHRDGDGVARGEEPPGSRHHPPPHRRLTLLGVGLVVVAGGEELVLGDVQSGADGHDHGHVRVGQRALPLAHGRLGDKQLLGQLPLGQPRLQPLFADVVAKGFLFVHVKHSPLIRMCSHPTPAAGKSQGFGAK